MRLFLKNLFLSARLWLSAGVLCLGVSILLGYHGDQMEAESALAQKIADPERVVIQEFSVDTDENQLREVRLFTEVATDHILRIDIGSEGVSRLVDIVPMYPVSRQSLPTARSLSNADRRPVPRSEAANIANQSARLAQLENVPVGLLVFKIGVKPLVLYLESVALARGQNGVLVDVSGIHVSDPKILQNAAGPLSKMGVELIEDALVISAFEGRSGPSGWDFSRLQNSLFWASFLMIAFGLASLFSVLPSFTKPKSSQTSSQIKAIGTPSVTNPFQPIAKQEELSEELEFNKTRRTSRAITVASRVFRTKSRP